MLLTILASSSSLFASEILVSRVWRFCKWFMSKTGIWNKFFNLFRMKYGRGAIDTFSSFFLAIPSEMREMHTDGDLPCRLAEFIENYKGDKCHYRIVDWEALLVSDIKRKPFNPDGGIAGPGANTGFCNRLIFRQYSHREGCFFCW